MNSKLDQVSMTRHGSLASLGRAMMTNLAAMYADGLVHTIRIRELEPNGFGAPSAFGGVRNLVMILKKTFI
jgi:hypothetical protein